MFTRLIALALVVVFATSGSIQSNAADANDRLRKLLEDKFKNLSQPKTRSAEPVAPSADGDLYIVKPDGTIKRMMPQGDGEPTQPPGDGQSSLPNFKPSLAATFPHGWFEAQTQSKPPATFHSAAPAIQIAQQDTSNPKPPAANLIQVQATNSDMVVNRRVIVIQLKPTATSEQIDDLISKYKLKVIKYVSFLGALFVEQTEPPQKRSGAAEENIKSLLEPPVVLSLRNEKAVNAAFVSSTISPKTIRHRSGASVQKNGKTVQWTWSSDAGDDGNWGLKQMRMPAVWTILSRFRKTQTNQRRTRVAILDTGFGKHKQLTFQNVKGGMPPQPIPADCTRSHGTHVAGVIAASHDTGTGIDGIVPQAQLDAIPISQGLVTESATEGTGRAQQHLAYFADVISDLGLYFDEFPPKSDERIVVNVSLAYNWSWVSQTARSDPTADRVIRDQIRQHAKFIQFLVDRVSDRVLFIAAAGNDSEGQNQPVDAKLATPFAFAAIHASSGFVPSKNILVVEAHDRNGARASFSNVGGHVTAPGVDVLSTLASDTAPYGACSGTSQAAPHVAALAAILFELDPSKTPAQVAKIIASNATTGTRDGGAPRVDALAAVLSLSNQNLTNLADLNGDSKVDSADLDIFRNDLIAIESGRFGEWINQDLNRDGTIDDNERCWPLIDLNGSGRASYDTDDARMIGGSMLSDLEVLKAAWTDKVKRYAVAIRDTRLDELVNVWRGTALVAAVPRLGAKPPCR